MDTIAIPLIIIMALSIILYTIGTFLGIKDKKLSKKHIFFFHISVLLMIIGIFYMSGISSQLSYDDATYKMMAIHQGLGYLAALVMIVHAIIITIAKRKYNKKNLSTSKWFNILSFILWLICIILYLITFYIGILATIK